MIHRAGLLLLAATVALACSDRTLNDAGAADVIRELHSRRLHTLLPRFLRTSRKNGASQPQEALSSRSRHPPLHSVKCRQGEITHEYF